MRIALVLLFLLCGVGVFAESQPSQIRPEKQILEAQKTHSSNRQDKKTQSRTTSAGHPPSDSAKNVKNADSAEDKNLIINSKIAKYTGYLALLGLLQFLVLACQFYFLRKTLSATEKAANAAKQSADVIPSTERAFLFASVEFKGGNITTSEDGHHCGTFTATITNYGKTPAILKKMYLEQVVQVGFPTVFTDTPDTNFPPGCVVGSGAPEPFDRSFKINPEDFIKIGDDELKWFCYGRVEYADIFGNPHKTGFCYEYFRSGNYAGLNVTRNNDLNYHD